MNNDIILTGPPRSGTTLACYLLNKVDDTIALHEPMNLQMFPDPESGLKAVRSFFPKMRNSLIEKGVALSKVKDGNIPSNPFEDDATNKRNSVVIKATVHFEKPLSGQFKLIIKHNGHFTFLLPQLQNYFPIYILLRNPVAVLASWNSIKAPVSGGNLRVLKFLKPKLYNSLESIPDLISRQIQLLDYMYKAYIMTTKAVFLRYEDLIASQGRILSCISPAADQLCEQLESKNKNPLYDSDISQKIKTQLLAFKGAYINYYPVKSIENY
jgi:hypothetical protein